MTDPCAALDACVLWAAATDLPSGWPVLSHTHSFYHLFYIRSGKAVFLLDGTAYQVFAGDCVIAAPGILHEVPAETHSLLDVYEVKFTADSRDFSDFLKISGPVISGKSAFLEQILPVLLHSWNVSSPSNRSAADVFLQSALLGMQVRQTPADPQLSAFIDISGYSNLVGKIIRYLEKRHADLFSLDQLAKELGYNKRYLCSAFRQATGITILDCLNHIRIRAATVRICYNDVPVCVVAQYVGFITPTHFTRVFKKLTGVCPTRFRSCYGLSQTDSAQQHHQAVPYHAVYEALLGIRTLPLAESIRALAELGRRAAGD